MIAIRTIAEMWAKYDKFILPKDAPEIQRTETRRAFYAAIQEFLNELCGPITDGSLDGGAAQLDRYLKELHSFADEIAKGKA
jgi:hypothetical protein